MGLCDGRVRRELKVFEEGEKMISNLKIKSKSAIAITTGSIALFCMSAAHAAEQVAPAQGGAASGVGKALGMVLFGFLALKFFNRNKDDGDDSAERRGGIRPIYQVLLAVMVGIFVFEKMKG
jgi:hypothetical protein